MAEAVENDDSRKSVNSAVTEVKEDIKRDLKELNTLRESITLQRRPMNKRREQLQKSINTQREEVARIRGLRATSGKQKEEVERDISALEEELQFISALFSEYARAMETRTGAAEGPKLAERLREVQQIPGNNESFSNLAETVASVLKVSEEWGNQRFGGMVFKGTALDKLGIEHTGCFTIMGPAAWFSADDEPALSGLVVTHFGSDSPEVFNHFDQETLAEIKTLTKNGQAVVPLDVTGGDAIKVEDARPTLLEHLKKGGFVMVPLLLVALTATFLALWKFIQLSFMRVNPGGAAAEVISAVKNGDISSAESGLKRVRKPLRSIISAAVNYQDSSREHLEEIMHEQVLAMLPSIERNLGALAVLGGVAPLLGLLGTVTGMIHTFQLVTIFGSGDAKLLSGGISEALVTTETGLAIAIPVLLIHAFLARRAKGIVEALECSAVKIINDLKRPDTQK